MNFSAWAEVVHDGAFHGADAIGRILMARRHSATDAAISSAFGAATLSHFQVVTEEVPPIMGQGELGN